MSRRGQVFDNPVTDERAQMLTDPGDHAGRVLVEVLVEVDPGDRFVEIVGTMFGLARDRKTDAKGLPRPLQLAVTARAYSDAMVVSKPPPWAQRLVFGMLAPLGAAGGLEPSYPQYLDDPESVAAVDPKAEALLDTDGRLRWEAESGDG